jgi:predicted flap endonuclease-1-like 5' DNA nuclease
MMGFTPNQWAVLGLVLLLGWLLGLLSRGGGSRWRAEAIEERRRREAAEARIAGANARIADLEREAGSHGIGAGTAASIGAAASGARDDLSLIRGVGRPGETRLNELGYFSYRDVAGLSDTEAAELEGRLGAEPGVIGREQWREQAALLAREGAEAHARRWP